MLSDIKNIIEEGHLGVRTYEQFVEACLVRCAAGDEDSVSLFILAKLVQPFCEYYADHALSVAESGAFRQRLLSAISAIGAADGVEKKHAVLQDTIKRGLNQAPS